MQKTLGAPNTPHPRGPMVTLWGPMEQHHIPHGDLMGPHGTPPHTPQPGGLMDTLWGPHGDPVGTAAPGPLKSRIRSPPPWRPASLAHGPFRLKLVIASLRLALRRCVRAWSPSSICSETVRPSIPLSTLVRAAWTTRALRRGIKLPIQRSDAHGQYGARIRRTP